MDDLKQLKLVKNIYIVMSLLAPGQSDTNLFSAESLGTIIEDLLYQSHKFDLRFLPLAMIGAAKNIVVKGSAGNIQCFT